MSPFFVSACLSPIKGASHKTMKNTRGEREGGRQPRPRKLPNGARDGIRIRIYLAHHPNEGKSVVRLCLFPADERLNKV